MPTRALFVTRLYEATLADRPDFARFNAELETACRALARDDAAGRAWCAEHHYPGYTSYASLNDLPVRDPAFGELKRRLDRHVAAFAEELWLDLKGRRLKLDSLWVNILRAGGAHSGHIHPHSVISGTAYVVAPEGAGPLKLEDPRLPMMMAAPSRRADAPEEARSFVYVTPRPGMILLWESWLRHEVAAEQSGGALKADRVGLSFNYRW